mgnify:CR=1 FL=1|tara:strand:- start:378 stop:2804 length:2427 start_codon:yes stop_codon:yes gene_type:complete
MRFILFIIFLNLLLSVKAQNINGKIQDKSNNGISKALLFIENNGVSFYGNTDGEFSIQAKDLGTINLVIFKEGYKEYRISISKQNFTDFLSITLLKIEQQIKEVAIVRKKKTLFGYTRIKSIEGTTIYSTKKAEIVDMETINANIANNSSRQIFSKVSGLNIWESDCSGLQLGIGSRGLSPSRTSNFNVRQNGYDISADAIGYPDAYYAPPMQALKSIEVVKGAASLQYGTQFGGLINFKYKDAPKDKEIQLNSSLTYGTNRYLNTFNSLSGTVDKLSYYTFYQYRKGDCWRCNSNFEYHSAFAKVKFQENEKLSFNLEYSYLGYLARQPGGLTDNLFEEDPQQSIRSRNWFKVFWNLLNFKMNYKISPKTTLDISLLGQYSGRDASGFLGKISRTDPLIETDLLQDTYTNYIAEARLLQKYNLFGRRIIFVGGLRYMQGITSKKQGVTSNDSIANFQYVNPQNLEGSDFSFPNRNVSVFTENVFNISDKFSITFGARLEYLSQKASGYYRITNLDFAGNVLLDTSIYETNSLERLFPFFGGGLSYKFNNQIEVYSNISQNYRAVGYNDLRITNLNLIIDENLADEKGFNFDLGVKGNTKNELFFYDGNLFILKYNNKIGTYFTTIHDPILINRVVRYRSNISSAISYGVEFFAQADIYRLLARKKENAPISLAVFTNVSLINAIYTSSQQTAFNKKKVEDVPPFTLRTGMDFKWKNLSLGAQFSYTEKHFSDATNTVFSADATVGIIPSYYTVDFNATYKWEILKLQVALNNVTNNKYFTQRADGYPGPGILPADAFNANVTLSLEI